MRVGLTAVPTGFDRRRNERHRNCYIQPTLRDFVVLLLEPISTTNTAVHTAIAAAAAATAAAVAACQNRGRFVRAYYESKLSSKGSPPLASSAPSIIPVILIYYSKITPPLEEAQVIQQEAAVFTSANQRLARNCCSTQIMYMTSLKVQQQYGTSVGVPFSPRTNAGIAVACIDARTTRLRVYQSRGSRIAGCPY